MLIEELQRRPEGEVYSIELGPLRPDPRIALRKTDLAKGAEIQELRSRLSRLDARAEEGAWTLRTLEALNSHPGVRAADVCGLVGQQDTLDDRVGQLAAGDEIDDQRLCDDCSSSL